MNWQRTIGYGAIIVACVAAFPDGARAAEQGSRGGVGTGETSQQKSQQGLGMEGAGSSGVLLGGPEIIIGRIEQVQGDEYTVQGDRGQFIKLRLTKDTNIVCPSGEDAKMTTSREGIKERKEIPVSPATEQEMKRFDPAGAQEERLALNDPNEQQARFQTGPPTKDPSTLKDVVGSTDQEANREVARGSGFAVGGSQGCRFKAGDRVRIEASDMGTITTIKSMDEQAGSSIAGRSPDQQ